MIEVLGAQLRQNENIKGIEINGDGKIGAQYDDDIWLSFDFDRENLDAALEEFD